MLTLGYANTLSILTVIFPDEPGLVIAPLIFLLHLFLDFASFWNRPKISMSFLTQSQQVFFFFVAMPCVNILTSS